MALEIYQRQFSISEILSEAWGRFNENFQLILVVTLIFNIPINIVMAFVPDVELMGTFKLYFIVLQILHNLFGVLAIMAIAYAIKNKIDGDQISIKGALKKSFSRWGAVIVTDIILITFLLGLTALLIIPGIIYVVYWSFTTYSVVLSGKMGVSALGHSKEIVKGRWWKVAIYTTVFFLVDMVLGLMAGIPHLFLPESVITEITIDTLAAVLNSFYTVMFTIFFINLNSVRNLAKNKTVM